MNNPLLISSYNKLSKRHAVFAEENESSWLYLHAPSDNPNETSEIVGDVFVCNTKELSEIVDVQKYRPDPPPIPKKYGNENSFCSDHEIQSWDLVWLENGNTILLTKNQIPWALITHNEKQGMSKAIGEGGPWGIKWNQKKYNEFG